MSRDIDLRESKIVFSRDVSIGLVIEHGGRRRVLGLMLEPDPTPDNRGVLPMMLQLNREGVEELIRQLAETRDKLWPEKGGGR